MIRITLSSGTTHFNAVIGIQGHICRELEGL